MSASIHNSPGRRRWSMVRDREGERVYTLQTMVVCTTTADGPSVVRATPVLPLVGSVWNFGNDLDAWAYCTPKMKVEMVRKDEPNIYWLVTQEFSTVPITFCWDSDIEDPLLIPPRVSGTFTKYLEEATKDKDGERILNSAFEPIRGAPAEFDANRPTVRIEQNVATLGLATFSQMVDTVNDDVLWGLAARKIKLSNVSWERKYHGTCEIYYTRVLDFDVNFNTFDRDVGDIGRKALSGEWVNGVWTTIAIPGYAGSPNPDPTNPAHFNQYKDANDENTEVHLNGAGLPSDGTSTGTYAAGSINIQYYAESDFLLLGIPIVL